MGVFRPWGLLNWAVTLSEPREWHFLGAMGTEERCLASWGWLRELARISNCRLLQIADKPSRYSEASRSAVALRTEEFSARGGEPGSIVSYRLLDPLTRVIDIVSDLEGRSASLVVDVTCLPKRFFFPIIREAIKPSAFRDVIVTYTSPKSYIQGEALSEDFEEWAHLPGFPAQRHVKELLIASVGFMSGTLEAHIQGMDEHDAIKLLIPFPAPIASVRRSWKSVFYLRNTRAEKKFENYRVDALDISAAFDRILSLSPSEEPVPAFAPFGPKPISVAMCLYASQRESAVYYPQPKIYHPAYSRGVGDAGDCPAVYAYWIKHNGAFLYPIGGAASVEHVNDANGTSVPKKTLTGS